MLPWLDLDTAHVPGGGSLRLKRRGDEFSIMLGANELMNSRMSGSEEALATLACSGLGSRTGVHILIGGLGMGFTLRAALAVLGTDARVTVAELIPAVVAWASGPMAGVFGGSVADPRVEIRIGDVWETIASARFAYDAILLDVDNGPEGLTRTENDALYTLEGLQASGCALKKGGALSVWSSAPDDGFSRRLRKAGLAVEEHRVRARSGNRGARHRIWIARKP